MSRDLNVALLDTDEFGGDKPNGIPGLTLGEIANLLDYGHGNLERFGSFDNPEAVIRDLWHEVNRLRLRISEAQVERDKLAARIERHYKHALAGGCSCTFEEDGATLIGGLCGAHEQIVEDALAASPYAERNRVDAERYRLLRADFMRAGEYAVAKYSEIPAGVKRFLDVSLDEALDAVLAKAPK